MSMNPGATIIPVRSMVRLREGRDKLPMAAMRPALMATSPAYQGDPVPSMIWPLAMTRSYSPPAAWLTETNRPAAISTAAVARKIDLVFIAGWLLQVLVEPGECSLLRIRKMLRIPQSLPLAGG